MRAVSIGDYRPLARRRVPRFLFDYLDGGSFTEATLAANRADLARLHLRQRVLRDVSDVATTTTLFGYELAMPVVLAPVGIAGMYARRGECQAVRAANAAGIPFTLSTVSACGMEEVAAAARQPFWFQLYVMRDRAVMRDLLARAKEVGCTTLVFTVDLPVAGTRYRDYRSGLAGETPLRRQVRRVGQAMTRPRWAWHVGLRGRPHTLGNLATLLGRGTGLDDFMAWIGQNFDPSICWEDLDFIREQWDGPIVLKGIMDVDDALQAAAAGVDGVVVSNHGGRQLDGTPSTASALPAIADAAGDRLAVFVDGGVSSGLDVLRMLALGARAVLIGRAWMYALAARGEAGVAHVLDLFRRELTVAMSLTGCRTIGDIGPDALVTGRTANTRGAREHG
jgi:L-lactate dehydrogenase (cytochrome)